ncbi:MAG TPA: DsrE family protein [Egibacteraceae bacterium]|nr:DsrE family protein [Egibacteraceae bacterium]
MTVALLVSHTAAQGLALARAWAESGDDVVVVLLDGAAAAARDGHADAPALRAALAAGVAVSAHDDALRRRGVTGGGLTDGVKTIDLDEVADLVAEGADKVVWL